MKWYLIVGVFILVVLTAYTSYNQSLTDGIEQYAYEVEKSIGEVEIRNYKPAYFNTVELEDSNYSGNAGKGFRILAGYIFGGNDEEKKIAMTSPVVMDMGESIKMKFMVPADEDIDALPEANDKRIDLEYVEAKRVAAIRFGGWASDKRIKSYAKDLFQTLKDAGVEHAKEYSYYGYNPPFQVMNRRNEIVVELR